MFREPQGRRGTDVQAPRLGSSGVAVLAHSPARLLGRVGSTTVIGSFFTSGLWKFSSGSVEMCFFPSVSCLYSFFSVLSSCLALIDRSR